MALGMASDFSKSRKQTYAYSHSWDLVIPAHLWRRATKITDEFKNSLKKQTGLTSLYNTAVGFATNASMDLNLRCKSSSLPKSTVRTEKVIVHGMSTQVILEDETEGSIPLVFLEDGNHELYRNFSMWKDMGATHRTYAQGNRGEFSADAVQLRLLNPNSASTDVRLVFNLYGVQPTKVELSNLDNNINFMTLSVTLKYDNFEVV